MTDPIRRCPDDGFFAGERCPTCGDPGRAVLGGGRRVRLSKFLSGALRHFPGDVGLALDEAGWTQFAALVRAATDRYGWADEERVAGVIATDPKGRFERDATDRADGGRARAAYGHSVAVDPDAGSPPADGRGDVPDRLYHGTAPRNLDSIREEGLRPMGRQAVHLSGSAEGARAVGRRHAADPIVLPVDAAAMRADGREIARRGPATYTTDRVPPGYLGPADGADGGKP